MTAVTVPGLENISRSLLPSLLARMPPHTTGFALGLSQARLVDWALEHSRRAQPVVADE